MEPMLMMGLMVVGLVAGAMGALFGIGGGIIYIPTLLILFDLNGNEAVAISLVGIIASSSYAASFFVERGIANVRIGLLLEITTAMGAFIGATIAVYVEDWLVMSLFVIILIYSAYHMVRSHERAVESVDSDDRFTFEFEDDSKGPFKYRLRNIPSGLAMCTGAGMISSMTGVGGGTIKVPLMNLRMGIPMKVATATSNYMIGITAFSGAIVYFLHGDLLPEYAAAVAIGAFLGSHVGATISTVVDGRSLRKYFSVVLIASAILTALQIGGVI